MVSKKSNYVWAVLSLNCISALLLGQAFSSRLNSLENNGRWTSTKTAVEYLNGAAHYFGGLQTLSHYHLNLGAWNGFQEVVSKESVDPKRIDFTFYLPSSSYFYVVFNKDDRGFSGIRISTSSIYDTSYFTAEDSGKFTSRTPFQTDRLQLDSWNTCSLIFSSSSVSLYLNEYFVRSFEVRIKDNQRFGFRGSARDVLIDDIVIRNTDGKISTESFFNTKTFLLCTALNFLIINILQVLVIAFLRSRAPQRTVPWNNLLLFNVRLVAASIIAFGFVPLWNARYPSTTGFLRRLQRQEDAFLKDASRLINEDIMNRYSTEKTNGSFRICFLGTSQTGGAGAKNMDDTFVRQIERKLNESRGSAPLVECINPSVGGGVLPAILPYYEKSWITLRPRLVIVNLSTNDDPDSFGKNLQRIIDINVRNHAETIFVLEGNSLEFPVEAVALNKKHAIMRLVGKENNILVLDAHEFLKQHKDDGILWWDIVHLTSFGHELMADYLYENIKPSIFGKNKTVRVRAK